MHVGGHRTVTQVFTLTHTSTCRCRRRLIVELLLHRAWEVRNSDVKKGMARKFEEHVRCVMATGTTARKTREGMILNASMFLKDEECLQYQNEIPGIEWYSKQREALGVESYLYTFMRIAGCESVQQWGFDETKIDGHDTFNQWAMLIDPSHIGNVTR